MSEKVIGYLLLFAGLFIIFASGLSAFSVFTGVSDPIRPFNLPPISLDLAGLLPPGAGSASAKTDLIPSETLNRVLNLASHLLLMGFIATLGFKVSSIGTQLLRPIEVKLKTKEHS